AAAIILRQWYWRLRHASPPASISYSLTALIGAAALLRLGSVSGVLPYNSLWLAAACWTLAFSLLAVALWRGRQGGEARGTLPRVIVPLCHYRSSAMKLTQYTDYSLRVLMYLGFKDGPATISEIAERYDISRNHVVKVVHQLGQLGYLQTVRGKGGGLRLARP